MNLVMFIIGAVIFSIFILCLAWDIGYNEKKVNEDNRGYYERHQPEPSELQDRIDRLEKTLDDVLTDIDKDDSDIFLTHSRTPQVKDKLK